jgi:hypothetical protein
MEGAHLYAQLPEADGEAYITNISSLWSYEVYGEISGHTEAGPEEDLVDHGGCVIVMALSSKSSAVP